MSEIIDFYSRFTADYIAWCQKHPDISSDEEKAEEILAEQTEGWYSSPKKWLNGKSPNEYFDEIGDPGIYTSMFVSYIENGMNLPEPLIDCMLHIRNEVYPILLNILYLENNADISPEALSDVRAKIVAMIDEMQLEHPYGRYVSLLLEFARRDDDLTDALCVALEETDKPDEVRKIMIDAYPMSDGTAKECMLDILCGFPDEDGMVCSLLAEEFRRSDIELAYVAELAGKLGDERLLKYLRTALDNSDNDYYTYQAIRFAIESISGELLEEKDFSGDPDYDAVFAFGNDAEADTGSASEAMNTEENEKE